MEISHSHANSPLLVRIWDKSGRLVYAEVVRTKPKPYEHEGYMITMPDRDLGVTPEGGMIDFQSLLPRVAE